MRLVLIICFALFLVARPITKTEFRIPIPGDTLIIKSTPDGSLTMVSEKQLTINGNGAGRNTSLTIGNGTFSVNDTMAVFVNGSRKGISSNLETGENTEIALDTVDDSENKNQSFFDWVKSLFG